MWNAEERLFEDEFWVEETWFELEETRFWELTIELFWLETTLETWLWVELFWELELEFWLWFVKLKIPEELFELFRLENWLWEFWDEATDEIEFGLEEILEFELEIIEEFTSEFWEKTTLESVELAWLEISDEERFWEVGGDEEDEL